MAAARPTKSEPAVAATVDGNRLTLLADGPARLEALIHLIEGATESLRVLYYMFLDDVSGSRVRDALVAATARGVKVSLLVDGFGSDSAKAEFFDELAESAVDFCQFSPRFGRR